MTIVVNVEELPLEQVTKQLNKLVNVIKIVELDPDAVGAARAAAGQGARPTWTTRSHVLETVQLFRAKVVDVAPDAVTIEATGTADKLDALHPGARALRHQGARAVRHGRGRPRLPLASPTASRLRPRRAGPRTGHASELHAGRDLLRRRRRPVDHPGPQGRRARLRQPGSRARAVAARLRRRRPRRSARGLEEPREGRGRGPAGRHAGRGRCRGRPRSWCSRPTRVQRKLYAEAIEPNLDDGDALFFGHGLNIRFGLITPPAGVDVAHGRAEGSRATWCAASSTRAAACRASSRSSRTPPARPGTSRCPTPRASAAPAPAR